MVRGIVKMKILIGVLVMLLPRVASKYVEGSLETKEDWAFLARFCFISESGKFRFEATYPKDYGIQKILLYYDDPDQWPLAYTPDILAKDRLNCSMKHSLLKPENNQIIELSYPSCDEFNNTYECKDSRHFISARERWWFIAVDNCGSTKGLKLDYKIWMTNGIEEDILHWHFSADEFNILETDLSFLVLFVILFTLSCYTATLLKSRRLYHSTYRMYMVSLATQCSHLLFMVMAYGLYSRNGEEQYALKLLGRIFESFSRLCFLLMLILLGKGFTVTRGRLRQGSTAKIAVFMTIYVVLYAALFIWEKYVFDPGLVLYLYESIPGYCLAAMRLMAWFWFGYAVFFTVKHFPGKSKFYIPFVVLYSIWFLAMPFMVLITHFLIPKYNREKIVNGVDLGIAYLAYLTFLLLTRPSAANENFPYHVRTTQISNGGEDVSSVNGEGRGTRNMDMFTAHAYAVDPPPPYSINNNQDNPFVTSRNSSKQETAFVDST